MRAGESGGVGGRGLCEHDAGEGAGAGMWALAPGSSCSRRRTRSAGRSVWPVMSGTLTCWPPSDSLTRTCQPRRTREPATGSCERTWFGRDRGGEEAVLDREVEAERLGGFGCVGV